MSSFFIDETYLQILDDGTRYRVGDSGLYPSYTTEIKTLFQNLQKEFGKCVSKAYVDAPENKAIPVGWVFQKRVQYTDSQDTYIQETWITLHREQPEKSVKYHYFNLDE